MIKLELSGIRKVLISKPSIKPGESRDDYASRCIPWVIRNEGREPDAAAGKCYGMYDAKVKKDGGILTVATEFLDSFEYISQEDFEFNGEIIQKGAELHLVTGVVLEPDPDNGNGDGQGDTYSEDEVRKTAHEFMSNYSGQGNGLLHKTYGHPKLRIVESYIAPVDFNINNMVIKKGTWLMSTLILDNQIWKDIKEGRITGYSIRGKSDASKA